MQSAISQPETGAAPRGSVTFWRGIWMGLVPLAALIIAVALTVALTILARTLFFSLGFLVWQWISTGIWAVGLVASFGLYAITAYRALREASAWRRAGLTAPAAATFWLLAISALLVLAPTLLALAWPQSPAPPRAP